VLSHPLPHARRDVWLPLLERDFGSEEEHTTRIPFRIPQDWRERTLLRFGAVDWRATVTLDGAELGVHEGGYTHFTFDAGPLEPGSEHELVIEAYDPHDDAFGQATGKQRGSHDIWYPRTTGAWRPVWIEGVPDEYIRDPQPLLDAVEIESPRPWSPSDPHLYDVELRMGDDVVHSYVGFRTVEARGRELYLNG
jgi:beta-galactosidase/beta-glucuronidase